MAVKSTVVVSNTMRTVAVMTLITSVVWTGVAVYRSINKPVDVNVPAEILSPVDPKIDKDALTALTQKRQLSTDPTIDQSLENALPSAEPSATPAPTPSINVVLPEVSPSPISSSSASPSGSLYTVVCTC